jgi:hypothetical protein
MPKFQLESFPASTAMEVEWWDNADADSDAESLNSDVTDDVSFNIAYLAVKMGLMQ